MTFAVEEAEGTLRFVGAGTSLSGGTDLRTATHVTLLEVGDRRLKEVLVFDYLQNFLRTGEHLAVRAARKSPSKSAILLAIRCADGRVERLDDKTTREVCGNVLLAAVQGAIAGMFLTGPLAAAAGYFFLGINLALAYVLGTAVIPVLLVRWIRSAQKQLIAIRDADFVDPKKIG